MGCSSCKKAADANALAQALGVVKSAGRAIRAYVNGRPVFSTTQMFMERIKICHNCPSKKYDDQTKRCLACGCYLIKSIAGAPGKATLAEEHCQLGHW